MKKISIDDLPIERRIGISTHFMPSAHGEDIFRAIELAHAAGFAGFFSYIDQLGARIVEVHHNGICHYWDGFIEHLPIRLNNTIDYQGTYDRLKALDYRGPIICEIMGPDIGEALRNCRESKAMICDIWNGVRLRERWGVRA